MRTSFMSEPKKTARGTAVPRGRGFAQSAENATARHSQPRLELPAGKPDLEGLRAVTREWLVPALVEKFLREHGIQLRSHRGESE